HMAFGDTADVRTDQNVAILSKRAFEADTLRRTIPGREGYFGELDDPETEAEARVTKGMSVVVNVDGQPVRIYAVHLKSERGGHEADAHRVAQASIVRRNYLKDVAAGTHVIVAGDLNDHRAQPALRRIRGFDDVGPDLAQTGGPTFFKKRSTESNADFNARIRDHWTYEFAGRRNQIDHILISQSVRNHCTQRNHHKTMQIEFIDVTETIAGTDHKASDHRAVKLTLEFLDRHR
ncbi:MAG: endonuclease/exonuclease/phosphatase family protein, partial [Planctomycetaceae bacterium]